MRVLLFLVLTNVMSLSFVTVTLRLTRVATVLSNLVADTYASDAHRWIKKATDAHSSTGWLCKVWLLLCGLVEVCIFRVVILVGHVLLLMSLLLVLHL